MRFVVGVSRVWVEQYVSQPECDDDLGAEGEIVPKSNAWLSDVVNDPGAPRFIRPVPARACHALTGRRVVHIQGNGTIVTDLRATGTLPGQQARRSSCRSLTNTTGIYGQCAPTGCDPLRCEQ